MKKILTMERKALFLQKPSGTIVIGGDLTERERKLYNGFLKVACAFLKKDPREHWFSVELQEIKKVLRLDEQDKNNVILKDIIKRMSQIMVEYNLLKKGKHIYGFAHLLDNVNFETDQLSKCTIIRFSIPEMVRLAILRQNIDGYYAKIDLVIIKGLKSKYSILLYELICDYKNVEIPEMTMEDFRKAFGIENKYKKIPDLKRWVLDPACEELNKNPYIDFYLTYKLIKIGRSYKKIKFIHRKKEVSNVVKIKEEKNTNINNLLKLVKKEFRYLKTISDAIYKAYKKHGFDYCKRNILYANKKATENYRVFLIKALQNDWGKDFEDELILQQKRIEEEKKRKIEEQKQWEENQKNLERNAKYARIWKRMSDEERRKYNNSFLEFRVKYKL